MHTFFDKMARFKLIKLKYSLNYIKKLSEPATFFSVKSNQLNDTRKSLTKPTNIAE